MNVLYLLSVWPEAQTSGASTRVLQLINCLREAGFSVTVAGCAKQSERSTNLEALGVKCRAIELNHSSFDAFLQEETPDLVLFDRFMTEEKFGWRVHECCPNALRVLDTIDLHSLREARKLAIKAETEALILQNEVSLREIAAIYRCDLSLFVGDYEVELVKAHFSVPKALLFYHPLTVKGVNDSSSKGYKERVDFIAIGSFLHPPNWDAVRRLKTDLWPHIRTKLNGVNLRIIGSYPPPKAKALHNPKEGFLVEGFVEDDVKAMSEARVHLAPLRIGAGVKSKCVLAMRAGTPTVTTRVGAEGLAPNKSWAGEICQDDKAFIEAAVALYQSEEAFNKAQEKGREILKQFDAKKWNSIFINKLKELKENLSAHRQANFTGQLLHHHQHSSTRFMAKWIEEKNKSL